MAHGWEGDKVRLVALDLDKHFDNAVLWMNDPEITQWLAVGDMPMTKLIEREWFDRMMKKNESEISFAIETLAGTHIGFSGIFNISWRHSTAESGSLIGVKEEHSKGYGTDAARVRARYAFDVLGLRMLYSGTFDGNERSYRMLKKVGYDEYGRRPRSLWKRGRFVDEILMYLDRDAWAANAARASA